MPTDFLEADEGFDFGANSIMVFTSSLVPLFTMWHDPEVSPI